MPEPWAAAARRVLPAVSPEVEATALWGPVIAWCLLALLAEAVDGDNIPRSALDLFDRLRLREPLGQAFQAMGLEGEEGWRTAARIKILLLLESGVGADAGSENAASAKAGAASRKLSEAAEALASEASSVAPSGKSGAAKGSDVPASRIPAALWQDPDVRWLTGYNEAGGHAYVNREQYAELLWWLSLPELLKLANMTELRRAAASAVSRSIETEVAGIEKAGYRVDALLKGAKKGTTDPPDATTLRPTVRGSRPVENASVPDPEELEPEEPVKAKAVGPADPEGPPEDF